MKKHLAVELLATLTLLTMTGLFTHWWTTQFITNQMAYLAILVLQVGFTASSLCWALSARRTYRSICLQKQRRRVYVRRETQRFFNRLLQTSMENEPFDAMNTPYLDDHTSSLG